MNAATIKAIKIIEDVLGIRFAGVDANRLAVVRAMNPDEEVTRQKALEAFSKVEHQLVFNSGYVEAYREFSARHPKLDVRLAHRSLLDEALVRAGDAVTVENLEDLLQPGNPNHVEIPYTQQFLQAQADEAETQTLRAELKNVKTQYDGRGVLVTYDEHGRITGHKDYLARIDSMSLEELRALRDAKVQRKQLRELPVQELKNIAFRGGEAPKTASVASREKWDSRFQPLPSAYPVQHSGRPAAAFGDDAIEPGELVPVTKRNLFRMHRDDLRDMIHRYGADQINAILNGQEKNDEM